MAYKVLLDYIYALCSAENFVSLSHELAVSIWFDYLVFRRTAWHHEQLSKPLVVSSAIGRRYLATVAAH